DIMMPMIYLSASNDGDLFNDNLLNTMSIPTNTDVRPTLASYLHVAGGGGGAALTRSQIERAFLMGADGINFYDQPAYFNGYSSSERASIKALIDSFSDPNASGQGNSLEDFEVNEGNFSSSPTFSGSNIGIGANSTATMVTTEAQSGSGSQELFIDGDPGGWFFRHLAGGGSPGNNDAFTSEGFIGFWLKTDDPGITVQIALDDPGTADRGFLQPVQADGEWHLYQWNLEDDRQWEGWVTGNGSITGSTVTIDSIQFFGAGDATIYLDTISHNPDGYLAGLVATDPADFDGDGDVDGQDLTQWLGDYGANGDSDANDDGNSDGADFLTWQQNFAPSGSGALASSAVPEPSTTVLLILAITGTAGSARKRR
ncbi:MAG: PEP-CTERM sorting domain-containing protein, partial [Lacipirellulaceae bacterium]